MEACGPAAVAVSKTATPFKGPRRGFAGAKPMSHSLDGYLDLQRRVNDPRIRRADPYTKRLFVHHFRVTKPDDLDEGFAGWVREAYAVGTGGYIMREGGPPGCRAQWMTLLQPALQAASDHLQSRVLNSSPGNSGASFTLFLHPLRYVPIN